MLHIALSLVLSAAPCGGAPPSKTITLSPAACCTVYVPQAAVKPTVDKPVVVKAHTRAKPRKPILGHPRKPDAAPVAHSCPPCPKTLVADCRDEWQRGFILGQKSESARLSSGAGVGSGGALPGAAHPDPQPRESWFTRHKVGYILAGVVAGVVAHELIDDGETRYVTVGGVKPPPKHDPPKDDDCGKGKGGKR